MLLWISKVHEMGAEWVISSHQIIIIVYMSITLIVDRLDITNHVSTCFFEDAVKTSMLAWPRPPCLGHFKKTGKCMVL